MVAGFLDYGAVGEGGTFIGPRPLDGGGSVDCYFSTCAEAEVGTVVAADESWVVGVGADAAA